MRRPISRRRSEPRSAERSKGIGYWDVNTCVLADPFVELATEQNEARIVLISDEDDDDDDDDDDSDDDDSDDDDDD